MSRSHISPLLQGDLSLLNQAVHEYTECLSADAAYPGALNNLGNALKEQVLPLGPRYSIHYYHAKKMQVICSCDVTLTV
jgi:hypothetical protein